MPLLCERNGAVAILTLSRPEARNAWCEEFQTGLRQRLPELEADPDIRCVILTGDDRGGAFSAGADLKNPRTHTMDSVAAFIEDLPNRRRAHPLPMLTDFAKPIIAAVNGYAVGIGCIVTYCCDMIVASERAEWRLPQSGLGIIPAQGGATRLARWVGKGLAMRAAFGFPLKAEEAYRIGLAQWLVPHDALMARAMEVAEHIASLPPLAARLTKESLNRGIDVPLADAVLGDLYRFAMLEMTEDKQEAHQAWRERASRSSREADSMNTWRTMPQPVRAVVVDPSRSEKLTLQSVELPPAATGDVTVRVTAISLNRGEVNRALSQSAAGARPGWDFAGVIEEAAADAQRPAGRHPRGRHAVDRRLGGTHPRAQPCGRRAAGRGDRCAGGDTAGRRPDRVARAAPGRAAARPQGAGRWRDRRRRPSRGSARRHRGRRGVRPRASRRADGDDQRVVRRPRHRRSRSARGRVERALSPDPGFDRRIGAVGSADDAAAERHLRALSASPRRRRRHSRAARSSARAA